jgi:hypothetical protein
MNTVTTTIIMTTVTPIMITTAMVTITTGIRMDTVTGTRTRRRILGPLLPSG